VDWLYENPLPELLICGVLATACLILALQKQRSVLLLGVLAFLLLGGGLWMVDRGVKSDREAVQDALYDIVAAYQRKDEAGTLKHISPQAGQLRNLAIRSMSVLTVEDDLRITDVSINFSNENSIARSHFRVNASVTLTGFGSQRSATRWEAEWQKTDQGWLMIDIHELDILTGQTTNYLESIMEQGR
jgi:hypothetical protein